MPYDFLILGSGIAGLTFALKASAYGTVCILTKGDRDESNTKYAQGGVAVVTARTDSFQAHEHDTLVAGDGLCDPAIVQIVIEEGPERVAEVIGYGAEFDRNPDGSFNLAREGGHGAHRVLHHKDMTGFELEQTLLAQIVRRPNITLITHRFAIDLITQHHLGLDVNRRSTNIACYGVYALNTETRRIETVLARTTVLCTGGAGHVYATTTNPTIATGDGIAMAYRAKAQVQDMEFMQFHPTALYMPGQYPSFLISEAVRGHGAILTDASGTPFMQHYDPRQSLAPRDIVARAIDAECKKQGTEHMWLDCRAMGRETLLKEFPTIYAQCLSLGIDAATALVPVAPAAHYLVGGVRVDAHGQTSIANLYACGECASTGLHGANRLASNSLLEALVFSHRAYKHAIAHNSTAVPLPEGIPDWDSEGTTEPKELVLINQTRAELQRIMANYVGIVRTNERLAMALARLALLHTEVERLYKTTRLSVPLLELRNLVNVAYLMVRSAQQRHESRGLHFTLSWPNKLPQAVHTVL